MTVSDEARERARQFLEDRGLIESDSDDSDTVTVRAAIKAMVDFAALSQRPSPHDEGDMAAILADPLAVHVNMLRGGIAKPSVEAIVHLYGEKALREVLGPKLDEGVIAEVKELRKLLKRATPLPWCWEQCGDKCDAPVIGIAWLEDDPTYTSVAGMLRDFDDEGNEISYYRENIAYEIAGPDSSPSSNAALIVAAINALPRLLTLIDGGGK